MSNRKADNLLLFKSIIDAGSLSTAAKECNISVSQASKRMSHLETTLGIQLIKRSTRKLNITPAGKELYDRLTSIKAEIDNAWNRMLEYANAPSGKLKIAAPANYASQALMPFIEKFSQRHPEIQIELIISEDDSEIDESAVDIIFRSYVLTGDQMIPNSNQIAKKVATDNLVYCAGLDYLKRTGTPKTPKDLETQQCLANGNNTWTFHKDGRSTRVNVNLHFISNHTAMIYQATKTNMGVAKLPQCLIEDDLNNETLIPLFEDFDQEKIETYAYYCSSKLSSKKVSLFLDELTKLQKTSAPAYLTNGMAESLQTA